MPTPRRDVVELRSEAVATIGELGVKEVARLEVGESQAGASYLDFSPDSRTLVTLDNYSNLDYWDIPNRKHARRLEAVSKSFTAAMSELNGEQVRFLADGDVAILTRGQRVSFFGASGQQSTRLPIESGTDKAVKLAIDRHCRWLAVGWDDGRIDVRDAGSGALRRSFARKPGKFAFSPDGKWLAVQAQYGPVQVLPTTDEGSPFTLGLRGTYYPAFAFSRDGATLAGVADRSLVLWDLASKEELLSLSGHRESVTGIAFSQDGALVATTCGDRKTRIWDARDGRALAVLPGPWFMRALAFSPDGNYLAASAWPGPVCLYQLTGWREQRRLIGHKFGVQCLAAHPRLPRFASGADDGAIMVWDAGEARPLRRWQPSKIWVTGLAYSPDGSLLASTLGNSETYAFANDNSIHLWDAGDGTLRKRLPRPTHRGVRALAFDPTGRRLASGDQDGSGRLMGRGEWQDPPPREVRGARKSLGLSSRVTVAISSLVTLKGRSPSSTWKGPEYPGVSSCPEAGSASRSTAAKIVSSLAMAKGDCPPWLSRTSPSSTNSPMRMQVRSSPLD